MFSEKDILIAKEIARSINIPCEFGPDEDCYFCKDSIFEQIHNFEEKYGSIEMRNGISKLVIIFKDLPFVIKLPFNGIWLWEENYNEETDKYEEERYFQEFTQADSSYGNDYCEAELNIINKVNHFGFGALMAEEIFIGEFNYCNFYIQEKVKRVGEGGTKPSKNSLSCAKNMSIEYKVCSDEWRAVVIDTLGEKFWKDFIDWSLRSYCNVTDDMHSGNYGYRYDGSPVMFDVSGFNEDC